PTGTPRALYSRLGHSPERRGWQAELHFAADRRSGATGSRSAGSITGAAGALFGVTATYSASRADCRMGRAARQWSTFSVLPRTHVATHLLRPRQRLSGRHLSQAV